MTQRPDESEPRTQFGAPSDDGAGLPGVPETGEDPLGKIDTVIGGKFRIRGHVKGGGFAEVYHGFNVNLTAQRVIIKFLRDATLADRFAKEAQLLCRLDHPNICRVIDYLAEEHAIIVPFIDGKDCERILRSTGPLEPETFQRVALTITDALAFAHANKIAHRDVKPGNILLDRHGIPYLIDFGIAKEIDVDSTSTRTGYVALTPQFAAPERQTGDTGYNPFLSDIYEMGVTLCVLATGELPYHNAAYPSLRDWDRTFQRPIPPALREVLKRATHPTPSERIQSAAELASLLRQVKLTEPPKRKSHTRAIAIGAAAVIVVAISLWQFGPWLSDESLPPESLPAGQSPGTSPDQSHGSGTRANGGEETSTGTTTESTPPDAETKEAQTPPAATEGQTQIRVDVTPRDNTTAFIDGNRYSLGKEQPIPTGVHRLRIVNPGYPLLERTVRVAARDTALAFDLSQEFAGRDTVDLRIALNPPSSEFELSVALNGAKSAYTSFPVRDIKRQAGRWEIELRLTARGSSVGTARIDSTVTFPYGGGPHIVIRGGRGEIDFGGADWTGKRVIPLQVNWSARQ